MEIQSLQYLANFIRSIFQSLGYLPLNSIVLFMLKYAHERCSHGFDGRSCLLKNICQAMEYVSQRDGVIAKILKLLIG